MTHGPLATCRFTFNLVKVVGYWYRSVQNYPVVSYWMFFFLFPQLTIYIFVFFFTVTNITVCWGLWNLCRRVNVTTDQWSYYRYTQTNINLTADRAVNGKFLEHKEGHCAGTNIDGNNKPAWWNISLPDLADIYKINLMFRQNCKFANPESSNALTTWKCKYIVWENRNIYCGS